MSIVVSDFFAASDDETQDVLGQFDSVFDVVRDMAAIVKRLLSANRGVHGVVMAGGTVASENVFVAQSARIEPGAVILGPAYIGRGVVIRSGAYIRENVALLSNSIVGHTSEVKNSLFLPHAAAPHFAYVGDSVLGARVNLGAGTKLSNLPITSSKAADGRRPSIHITIDGQSIDTGLPKLGAILGDEVEIGCNAVLSPGTLVGPRTLIYPNASVRKGWYPGDSIIKHEPDVQVTPRRP